MNYCLEKTVFHAKTRRHEEIPMGHELLSRKVSVGFAALSPPYTHFHGFRVSLGDVKNCYEEAAHKVPGYREDQLEPPGKNSRVVRVVDCSGAFSWFGVSPRDMRNSFLQNLECFCQVQE